MREFDYDIPVRVEVEGKTCIACGARMRAVETGTRMTVHLPDPSEPEIFWTAAPVDAWVCTECGKTDLYARHPQVFRH